MKSISDIETLDELWEYTNLIHKEMFPDSKLSPIMGGGKVSKPKFMFVFINPTYKNISSDPSWIGKRRPWTGTKYIWKILTNAGLFDNQILMEIQNRNVWDAPFADRVYSYIEEKELYFTNLVKWTGENGNLPDKIKIKLFLPILKREISLVNPTYIVCFGLMPFQALVKEKLKLIDYYNSCVSHSALSFYTVDIENKYYSIMPCYFPVGRGDPKRATMLLRLLDRF